MTEQHISFYIGLVVVVLNIYDYLCRKRNFYITVFWVIFWASFAAYYCYVLYGPKTGSHELSSFVRLFRNGMLASWYIYNRFLKR